MKKFVNLLVLFSLCYGAEIPTAKDIENELMSAFKNGRAPQQEATPPSPLAEPPHVGENIPTSSHIWPEISFMDRILAALFPSKTETPKQRQHFSQLPTTTHGPLLFWRFRFFVFGANSTEDPMMIGRDATTEDGERNAMDHKTESTSSTPTTAKSSKTSRGKRNKEDKVAHKVAKRLSLISLPSYMSLDNHYSEGSNSMKKPMPKSELKWISYKDIGSKYNKSSNGRTCFRRLYTYAWTVDWNSLFVHVAVVLVFILTLTAAIVYCHTFTNTVQVDVKRLKFIPNDSKKFKPLQVYSMC